MREDAAQRAMQAYDLMVRTGVAARPATTMSGTTVATLKRWMENNGINYTYRRRRPGAPLQIVPERTPEQKIADFLEAMGRGVSASKAAKDLRTSVKVMSKLELPDGSGIDRPILEKSGKRWKAMFRPLHRYSTVVYGKLESMDDTVLGRGGQSGPRASKKKASEYTDIWWQFDLDPLTSILSPMGAVAYHKPGIEARLRQSLLIPNRSSATISSLFTGSSKVRSAALASGRWSGTGPMQVSRLEELLQRFDLKLTEVKMGVDDNVDPQGPDFIHIDDVVGPGPVKIPTGRFQVFFLDDDDIQTYPSTGGIPIRYRYDISKEKE